MPEAFRANGCAGRVGLAHVVGRLGSLRRGGWTSLVTFADLEKTEVISVSDCKEIDFPKCNFLGNMFEIKDAFLYNVLYN